MSNTQKVADSSQPTSPAPGPILSFKKRKNKAPPSSLKSGIHVRVNDSTVLSSPEISNPSTPTSAPSTPILGGPRKVSTRRKALQDFYKLHSPTDVSTTPTVEEHIGLGLSENEPENTEKTQKDEHKDEYKDPALILESLTDENAMQEFLKTATTRDILRARNAAADRLNLHDSEKKSMIYNNYSELIKLNQILNDVFAGKQSVSEFSHAEDESTITNSSIDEYLADLSGFLQKDAAVFNQDFASVVQSVCSQVDGTDSVSSVAGIVGTDH